MPSFLVKYVNINNILKKLNRILERCLRMNKKIKVLSVFGTRPEAIKMCPLVKELERRDNIESIVCVTAQHREMLDNVLKIFNVVPDYDLNIMKHGQSIVDISNKVLSGVSEVIEKCKPDIILVHGDTSTTLNGALAGFYNGVKVGHVEAGLRSFDMKSPFPEEANRKLTGAIADFHFAPTYTNRENLMQEGIKKNIFVVGNTVIDALLSVIKDDYKFDDEYLNSVDFENKKVILLTTHRRENWGKPMENIFESVIKLIDNNDDVEFIFPMHKNPSIRELAHKYFDNYQNRVHLVEPLEYLDFANAMAKSFMIMTDSGGIQEEAPALGKPVIVLRTETERPEAIEAGTVVLGGIETNKIYNIANKLINNNKNYENMSKASNPYGDGTTSSLIADIISLKLG
jgi:UDP-N-acetylglucosamine 2-epimerase (non-hydrolysing)